MNPATEAGSRCAVISSKAIVMVVEQQSCKVGHAADADVIADPASRAQPRRGLATALPLVFGGDARGLATTLDAMTGHGENREVEALIRLGLLQPERSTIWYQRLLNRWEDLGRPALKPNPVSKRLVCLSNFTIDNLGPLVTGFAAALGVHLDVEFRDYDSVELEALDARSSLRHGGSDFVAVILSEHWLHRYLGHDALVSDENLQRALDMLERIAAGLVQHCSAQVLITNFALGDATPGGAISAGNCMGRTAAQATLNKALHDLQSDRLIVLDQAQAVHLGGGSDAYSASNYLRAKMPYEQRSLITLAREIAFAIASLCGKGHRALVTDLDNTMWGGVVGDVGRHGVITGQDDPDGLAYYRLQTYYRSLRSIGVLLGVASKNAPQIQDVLSDNPDLAINLKDFASVQIHWEPKSRSIAKIAADLGFGPEYMVFVDDNLFELAEVLTQHPYIDVISAATDPVDTLHSLRVGRYFHCAQITETDLQRHEQIQTRRAATELEAKFSDYEEYLRAIHIKVEVEPLAPENRRRVVQMLHKSNQFNLTTRRHSDADLDALIDRGAIIGVFSYEDDFGPQGIISTVILVPKGGQLHIDSWVMSCRVLNRSVEHAVCRWIVDQARGSSVVGEFIGTEKNAIVRGLYDRLGFTLLERDEQNDLESWILPPQQGNESAQPIATLVYAQGASP